VVVQRTTHDGAAPRLPEAPAHPVNRLHSSSSPFNSKEPWRFGPAAERVMTRYLALRHQLVPYLCSAMWEAHTGGVAPVRPMYHAHPSAAEAYEVPNRYMFGPSLLVAPITTPADVHTHHAAVTVWLPDGIWFDVFDGRRYEGGRVLRLHRTLENIPVLARAGTILPLAADPSADVAANPEALVIKVFVGASGDYVLLEDDGSAEVTTATRQETAFAFRWDDRPDGSGLADAAFTVAPPTGEQGARPLAVSSVDGTTLIHLGSVDLAAGAEVRPDGIRTTAGDGHRRIFDVLDQAEIAYDVQTRVLSAADRVGALALLSTLPTLDLPGNLREILTEIIAAAPTGQRSR
jgi:hypothetical protein